MRSKVFCEICKEEITEDDKYVIYHELQFGCVAHVVAHTKCQRPQEGTQANVAGSPRD